MSTLSRSYTEIPNGRVHDLSHPSADEALRSRGFRAADFTNGPYQKQIQAIILADGRECAPYYPNAGVFTRTGAHDAPGHAPESVPCERVRYVAPLPWGWKPGDDFDTEWMDERYP